LKVISPTKNAKELPAGKQPKRREEVFVEGKTKGIRSQSRREKIPGKWMRKN